MGGGFGKEVGAMGPIVAGLAGSVLVGGIFIYMGLHSSVGGKEEGRDDNYKYDNDENDDDNRYDLQGTFPGHVVVGTDTER